MKLVGNIMLGIWCAVTSFISPVWLTMVILYMTGAIYRYDVFVDEGTAGFLGTFGMMVWALIVLLPDIWFLVRMKADGRRSVLYAIAVMAFPALVCMAMCGWDMVRFLTE